MSIATFEHPNCIMCSSSSNMGLKLRFKVQPDGSVLAMFPCHDILQSYPKTLHGGMVSALLDAAMTNVLFSIGVVAVTAELTVKFHAPVNPDRFVAVSGTIDEKPVHPLYYVSAQIVQDNKVMAKATAKFIAKNAI
ncbi:MAG: PaaI family thioesterase [Deltaproteobacteria bacterium]|nr:PaaI family thioesterase [Deltaproteobacteria bacterium]